MNKFMVDILLSGIDPETRLRLVQADQAILKEWQASGILVASYIKEEIPGIYIVMMANDIEDVNRKLETLPLFPYMQINIVTLR